MELGSANYPCSNKEQTTRGIQINYTFLIAPEIRSITMKSDQDDNRQLLFSSGMRPLKVCNTKANQTSTSESEEWC